MLNLKKVIALVCTLALVITSVSVVSFAEAYTDVTESSAYYEAVESLSKLGIVTGYEDGTYKPEETVTRAEMAALIARIQGYEETAKANANTVFTDVPSTYWASGYVAQANGQGIINGYGDGTFGPDDAVKYEEAVKMIMATLGYTPYAMNNGGYPTGYLAAAQFYGVTKGVSNAVTGTGANRGTIAQLLANAIDTPIMGQSKWSTDGSVEYTIYDGKDNNSYKTLMSENLDVVKLKGVIKESSVASLKGDKEINNDEAAKVKVTVTGNYDTNNKDFQFDKDGDYTGEDTFLVAESDAEDYLGMAVILYVRENDDNEYEVISIAADGTKNDIVTFTLDQFDVVEKSTSGSTTTTYIKYFKNSTDSSSIKKQLASNYAITINGASKDIKYIFGDDTNDGVVAKAGKSQKGGLVTLIDNDGKTGYDVVMVEVAATAVVDEIGDETVSFKEQAQLYDGSISSLDVEEDAADTVIDIVKDGKAIAYTDLKEWDVLSIVAPNENNTGYIKVDVISNPVTGQITSDKTSKTSATNKAYKIDGKFYDVAKGSYKTSGLSVNDAGIFYIDKYGKIAAFSEDSSVATGVAGTYGYVFNTLVTDKNMDKEVQVKLITANGAELLKFASTVNVSLPNNKKATFKTSDIKDVEDENETQNGFKVKDLRDKVVKYTKNSSGALKTIVFADYNDSFESVWEAADGKAVTETYDADNYRLGKYIDKDSKVFFVNKSDADKCSLGTPEDLSDNNTYKVLAFYADSKAEENNIVVIEGNTNTSSKATSLAVITSAATAKDENDNDIMTLSYIVDGTVVKDVDTIDDVDIVNGEGKALNVTLNAGDIVRIKTNSAGKISGITVLWDMAEDVRADYDTKYATQKTTGDAAGTRDGETLYGGAVTAAKDSDKVYFGKLDWNKKDSNGNVIALADQVTEWVNLGKAKNVYTVQTIREGNVQVKKGGSFNYVKQMFDNTNPGKYNFVYNGTETEDEVNEANLAKYVDHVFVREYDGRIEDVVIVKAPKKVSAR